MRESELSLGKCENRSMEIVSALGGGGANHIIMIAGSTVGGIAK